MHKLVLFLAISVFFSKKSHAQNVIEHGYHPPLGIPLVLSSNFGELRPNHFHMGLDFKTNGREGYNIYSIEEGFVSRVKSSSFGYGKVVYIDHPNGVTSVYAHCSEFKNKIDSVIKFNQNESENFEVDVYLKPNEVKVKRGEVIAISGNSGGSTAPHLHFELRDTKTEHALNPITYGFKMSDNKAPEIRGVKIYSLTKEGYRYPSKSTRKTASLSGKSYVIPGNEISIPANYITETGGIGFAFDVIDRLDGANNKCGLYEGTLIVNNDTVFGHKLDRVPFESTRFVNCHKDYEEYAYNRRKFHKSFKTQENDLPIYTNSTLGVIKAQPGDKLSVLYIAKDASGNQSKISFTVNVLNGKINSESFLSNAKKGVWPSETLRVSNNGTTVDFGLTTVYEPMEINSATIDKRIGDPEAPVNKAYLIKINSTAKKDGKHYLKMITAKGRSRALKLTYDDTTFYCYSKYFGTYSIQRDETTPNITNVNLSQSSTVTSLNKIKWKINDSQSGIEDYDLFINGEWRLLEYDYKTRLITYERLKEDVGNSEIKLLVKDKCGNTAEWKSSLILK